jgi:hypothetical protein
MYCTSGLGIFFAKTWQSCRNLVEILSHSCRTLVAVNTKTLYAMPGFDLRTQKLQSLLQMQVR